VLDIGCGTGTFACLLAQRGKDVTGVDPASASLDVARRKSGAAQVRWLKGDATTLPPLQVDMVTMTAVGGPTAEVWGDHCQSRRSPLLLCRLGFDVSASLSDPDLLLR